MLSLFGGCFGLPIVLRSLVLPSGDLQEREKHEARTLAAAAAVRALEKVQQPADGSDPALYREVLGHVTAHYRSVSRIDDDTLRSLVDEIDLIEASIRAEGTAP